MPEHLSREFLEELAREAKRLPIWQWAVMRERAKARAGGRSAHRDDQPTAVEKLALMEIRPAALRELDQEELVNRRPSARIGY